MGGGGGGGRFKGTKGSGTKIYANSKAEAKEAIKSLPPKVQGAATRMIKRASDRYTSFEVKKLPNGNTLLKVENPGQVPGSKAIYYKELNPNGETIRMYKETYDPKGNLVHIKEKAVEPSKKE